MVQRKDQAHSRHFGIFFSLVLCGVAFVVCKILGADQGAQIFALRWWLAIVNDLAVIAMTAIITSGLLKVMFLQGYFKDALTDIIFGTEGLDRMTDQQRIAVWKLLTCRIHAPFLHEQLKTEQVARLHEKIMEAEGEQIAYDKPFYIESTYREIEVYWCDQDNGTIQMRTFFQSTIVPFDKGKEIEWKSRTTADFGLKIDDYGEK